MRITIVGGGTAGWLTALLLTSIPVKHEVTLVADEAMGIIGVGESTTAALTSLLVQCGIDMPDFCSKTGAMPKLVKKFVNWKGTDDVFYCPIDGSATQGEPIDHFSYYLLAEGQDTSLASRCRRHHIAGSCPQNPALHIDTFKTADYLKAVCLERGVRYINGHVSDVTRDEQGNVLSVGVGSERIESDFWFDASGQKRILSSHVPFVPFSEYLPVDRAISAVVDREGEYVAETTSTALSAGWAWDIPTAYKRGIGYVYSSAHISDSDAKEEFNRHFGTNLTEFKTHQFESGRLKTTWNENVLSIGMCAGFLEPLQATSIHTTIMQVSLFVSEFLGGDDRLSFNAYMTRLVTDFRDLVSLNYTGPGTGSEFWRSIKTPGRIQQLLTEAKDRVLKLNDFPLYYGAAGSGVWMTILTGLNHIPASVISEIEEHNPNWREQVRHEYQRFNDISLQCG